MPQKVFADLIFHRFQILKYLTLENKHKVLIECYNQLESNKFILNTKEKKLYKLNLTLSLILVFTRAEDETNFNKYFKKYFELLNKISTKDQIFYVNRVMKLIHDIVEISSCSKTAGKYEDALYDYMIYVENYYLNFYSLDKEKLNNHIDKVNYIFGDFYYTGALIMKEVNIDDSIVSMNLANQIYYYKLGELSQIFKESRNYIIVQGENCTLEY